MNNAEKRHFFRVFSEKNNVRQDIPREGAAKRRILFPSG
jgi:hypothetical protein